MFEKLGIDWKLLSFQIANFLLLLFILRRVLYKPVLNFLEARRKKIEEGLEKAERFEAEWLRIKDIQKEKVEETEKEAVKIMEKARLDAEKRGKEIVFSAQQKSEKIIEETQKDILLEKEKISQELKSETADYIVFATEKILKRTISNQDEKNLIKETLDVIKNHEK